MSQHPKGTVISSSSFYYPIDFKYNEILWEFRILHFDPIHSILPTPPRSPSLFPTHSTLCPHFFKFIEYSQCHLSTRGWVAVLWGRVDLAGVIHLQKLVSHLMEAPSGQSTKNQETARCSALHGTATSHTLLSSMAQGIIVEKGQKTVRARGVGACKTQPFQSPQGIYTDS